MIVRVVEASRGGYKIRNFCLRINMLQGNYILNFENFENWCSGCGCQKVTKFDFESQFSKSKIVRIVLILYPRLKTQQPVLPQLKKAQAMQCTSLCHQQKSVNYVQVFMRPTRLIFWDWIPPAKTDSSPLPKYFTQKLGKRTKLCLDRSDHLHTM